MFLSLGPKVLKDAEKCWERAPEVNPSPPVISFHHMQLQRESKSDMQYHLAHLCGYLQTCQGPCDCKPLNHQLRMCANIVHVFACRSKQEVLHCKLPSCHRSQSTHNQPISAKSNLKNPFLGRGMAPHLSHLVSACRHTLVWAPSFRLPVDSVHFAENMCAVVETWWGVWSSIPKRNPKNGNLYTVGKWW